MLTTPAVVNLANTGYGAPMEAEPKHEQASDVGCVTSDKCLPLSDPILVFADW